MEPLSHMPIVVTEDLARARAFYVDVLGLREVGAEDTAAFYKVGEQLFVVNNPEGLAKMVNPDLADDEGRARVRSIHSIRVHNVDASYKELVEKGVTFIQPPQSRPWGMRIAFFEDPDGHVWEIAQDLDEDLL